jgi:hypothetical protein
VESVHQLRVTLDGVTPPAWRRILVPSTISLAKLHEILQVAMGWEDEHLYLFKLQDRLYGQLDPEWELPIKDAAQAKLDKIASRADASFVYEYDLGDSWLHEVVVEQIGRPEQGSHYPMCVAGERACPPEDCGGSPGYEELCRVTANPKHRDHKRLMTWLGGHFDPEAFDVKTVNDELHWIRIGRSFPRI